MLVTLLFIITDCSAFWDAWPRHRRVLETGELCSRSIIYYIYLFDMLYFVSIWHCWMVIAHFSKQFHIQNVSARVCSPISGCQCAKDVAIGNLGVGLWGVPLSWGWTLTVCKLADRRIVRNTFCVLVYICLYWTCKLTFLVTQWLYYVWVALEQLV